jgi:hypothetical protein
MWGRWRVEGEAGDRKALGIRGAWEPFELFRATPDDPTTLCHVTLPVHPRECLGTYTAPLCVRLKRRRLLSHLVKLGSLQSSVEKRGSRGCEGRKPILMQMSRKENALSCDESHKSSINRS